MISFREIEEEQRAKIAKEGGHAFGVSGMTLRDYFAGHAVQPLITSAFNHNASTSSAFHTVEADEIAAKAYVLADAMLRERHQKEPAK